MLHISLPARRMTVKKKKKDAIDQDGGDSLFVDCLFQVVAIDL